jgi:hypothetical protein
MMHDTITERRGGDQALFWLAHGVSAIGARTIDLVAQILLQLQQFILQMVLKRRDIGAPAFPARRRALSEPKILEGVDLRIDIARSSAHLASTLPALAAGERRSKNTACRYALLA